jgi:hypothetical protein
MIQETSEKIWKLGVFKIGNPAIRGCFRIQENTGNIGGEWKQNKIQTKRWFYQEIVS